MFRSQRWRWAVLPSTIPMNINTQEQTIRPTRMRSLSVMQESQVAAPQLEPGKQTLRVTVDATIELVVK